MIGAFFYAPNGRAFAIVGRSGSYSVTAAATPVVSHTKPANWPINKHWHPIYSGYIKSQPLDECDLNRGLAVLVRDPIERFKSACNYANISIDIAEPNICDPRFRSLEQAGLIRNNIFYFKFPEQIEECVSWLGLKTPVLHTNQSITEKPTLFEYQLQRIQKLYAADIELWKSIQNP